MPDQAKPRRGFITTTTDRNRPTLRPQMNILIESITRKPGNTSEISSVGTRPTREQTVGYRQLLRENRDFRNLWFGQLVSEVGDWFNNIALLAIVTELTGSSAIAISIYIISRHLPLFVIGPIAGVLSDRLS